MRPGFILSCGAIALTAVIAWSVIQQVSDALATTAPSSATVTTLGAVAPSPMMSVGAGILAPEDSSAGDGTAVVVAIADKLRDKTIEFEFGGATLTPRGTELLDEIASLMRTSGAQRFEVGGHTDATGDAARNQSLSEERAAGVVRYLVNHGIALTRLRARGFGATRPISTDTTARARQRNRRIEFTLLAER